MRNRQAKVAVPGRDRHSRHPHHHVNLRMERWHRYCLYGSCAWLIASGALFLIAHYFLRTPGEFGEVVHPLEPWSMRLHGAGAMVALFFLGSILNSHIRRAIKSGRNLYSGWTMIVMLSALTVTGYGLYYVASESDRPLWSTIHWAVGLLLSAVIVLHIVLGRKTRAPRIH